eukprot:scaffold1307_cov200-Pinguiococcus_pyrenoidosus.AAC.40
MCDQFLLIKQFGNGTASLNVAVATHIVCQRYASWREAQEVEEEADARADGLAGDTDASDRRKAPGKEALDGDSGSAKAVDSCALNLQHTHDRRNAIVHQGAIQRDVLVREHLHRLLAGYPAQNCR